MPDGSFSARAVLHGGRWQHHRLRDHFGVESDLYVVLSERLGPWEEGTPIHFVIDDLLERMAALEGSDHMLGDFSANAYLIAPGSVGETTPGTWRGVMWINAVTRRTMSSSFTMNAVKVRGGTIAFNAIIIGTRRFTADAVLV